MVCGLIEIELDVLYLLYRKHAFKPGKGACNAEFVEKRFNKENVDSIANDSFASVATKPAKS